MKIFSAEYLTKTGIELFVSCGTPMEDAKLVTEELVESSLMGIDSHGVIRFIEYSNHLLCGKIRAGADINIIRETDNTALVECGMNFGIVSALKMVEIAYNKAISHNISCIISKHCYHVGRLGAYVQKLAERGLFAFAVVNSSKHGHWVSPWGGKNGRLATNPLAYAFPTKGNPVVFDTSTSMISEGKIRLSLHKGEDLPEGYVLDANGNPTKSPKAFYGPPKGTILPFGGESGYKGFGLSVLVELLGSTLAGVEITPDGKDDDYVNGLCIIAINPGAFGDFERFRNIADDLCNYITSANTAPGFSEVVMPGAYDFRMKQKRLKEGIPVADDTWNSIINLKEKFNIQV